MVAVSEVDIAHAYRCSGLLCMSLQRVDDDGSVPNVSETWRQAGFSTYAAMVLLAPAMRSSQFPAKIRCIGRLTHRKTPHDSQPAVRIQPQAKCLTFYNP